MDSGSLRKVEYDLQIEVRKTKIVINDKYSKTNIKCEVMDRIQKEIGKAKKAIDDRDYNRAKDICKAALKEIELKTMDSQDRKRRMTLLELLADISKHQGRLVDTLMYLDHLIEDACSMHDHKIQAKALNQAGFTFLRMGKHDKALEMHKQAEKIVKNFKNPLQYGWVLLGMANVYWRTGQNEKVIEMAKKCLEISTTTDEYNLTSGAASVISAAWLALGQLDKSLEASKQAVDTNRKSGNMSELARSLNNQGEIYKRMKKYDRAIEAYKEGITILGERKDHRLEYLFTNIAECQARLGRKKEAESSARKAEDALKGSEDKYVIACLWFVKGLIEENHGKPETARSLFRKAEKRMAELAIPYELGNIRYELACNYLKNGNEKIAQQFLRGAIEAYEEAGSVELIKETQKLLKNN
ncbi:MAG: tetratricopeptide repeat protein [Thermoplasmata archaeon]|nr:tetratricopeptide repeat protein [Thermoplasmata archaeon]